MSRIYKGIIDVLESKRVEPVKRLFEGSFTWAIHRYPIKNGISLRDVMVRDMCKPNPLFKIIMEQTTKSTE